MGRFARWTKNGAKGGAVVGIVPAYACAGVAMAVAKNVPIVGYLVALPVALVGITVIAVAGGVGGAIGATGGMVSATVVNAGSGVGKGVRRVVGKNTTSTTPETDIEVVRNDEGVSVVKKDGEPVAITNYVSSATVEPIIFTKDEKEKSISHSSSSSSEYSEDDRPKVSKKSPKS